MLIKAILSAIGIVGVAGLLGATVPTTFQLAAINGHLQQSVATTAELGKVEEGILTNNQEMTQLANTSIKITKQLKATQNKANQISSNITTINALNKTTLKLNQALEGPTKNSAAALTAIDQVMGQLDSAAKQLSNSLQSLGSSLNADVSHVQNMANNTKSMDSRVPGV